MAVSMLLAASTCIFLLAGVAAQTCSDGWHLNNGTCYHFSHDLEDWRGAMYVCKIIGGHLVEVGSQAEHNYLQANSNNVSYWIGLTDLVEEGIWEWMTTSTLLGYLDFTIWADGQPDNNRGEENCIIGNPASAGNWSDDRCVARHHYICEAKPIAERY